MTLEDMITVLQAAQRGEQLYYRRHDDKTWVKMAHCEFNFSNFDYRIAPKKELSLVEELRNAANLRPGAIWNVDMLSRAADRIDELEKNMAYAKPQALKKAFTTDELLDEIKRRTK